MIQRQPSEEWPESITGVPSHSLAVRPLHWKSRWGNKDVSPWISFWAKVRLGGGGGRRVPERGDKNPGYIWIWIGIRQKWVNMRELMENQFLVHTCPEHRWEWGGRWDYRKQRKTLPTLAHLWDKAVFWIWSIPLWLSEPKFGPMLVVLLAGDGNLVSQ